MEKRGHLFYSTPLGRALLAGYVAMGFDLGKPQLRAEMERDMNDVAARTRTKGDVVAKTVRMMATPNP